MELTIKQRKYLKAIAHGLKPVIMVGDKGLSENLRTETDLAASHHELIKVKFAVGDSELRDQMIAELAEPLDLTLVQRIGNVAVFYRPRPASYKAGKRTTLEELRLPKG
ncbi:MAG: YhbY family RNA-binding protein [Gammaproteobacteria bacterium]|nr:YhbY family RNA-binding protein [Gammaproteobacteria bacterium]